MTVPAYAIGSDQWPGLAKLVEELGELQQVLGKLMAYPGGDHPDGGPPLEIRVMTEAGDVMAALDFLFEANPALPPLKFRDEQADRKLDRFRGWHEDVKAGRPT